MSTGFHSGVAQRLQSVSRWTTLHRDSSVHSHVEVSEARLPRAAASSPRFVLDGVEGNRTPDLLDAIEALSQLSYNPLGKGGAS